MLIEEVWWLFGAVFCYTFAFVAQLAATVFKRNWARVIKVLIVLGLLLHTFSMVARWYISGHAPANVYELSVLAGWSAVFIYLLVYWFYHKTFGFALIILPLVLLQTGYGLFHLTAYEPLKPEYQSLWLTVHIIFAFVATGCYVVAFAGATLALGGYPQVPTRLVLDDFNAKLIAMGFVSHFLMICTGAIWAQEAWGSYWSWDPIETWSLITWIVYGWFLHLYYLTGLRGRRMDGLIVACFLLVVFSYWSVPHIPIQNFAELYTH